MIFSDELNHASIIDGARLSRAHRIIFPHRDVEALKRLLVEHRRSHRRALVVSEAIFSMDGTAAPLAELRSLCDHFDAALMVDEAHAFGLLGREGRGLSEALGIKSDITVATLGKAAGASGAVVACSENVRSWLFQSARSFVFSTAPPEALCNALLDALPRLQGAIEERARVLESARSVHATLIDLGIPSAKPAAAIVPAVLGAPSEALRLERRLSEAGILARAIRPPTVPKGTSRVRLVPTATHTRDHIRQLTTALHASFT